MTTEGDKIVDKIKKLLAKANSTTNENEALVFNEKAYELLRQHNLEFSQVSSEEVAEGVVELKIKDVNTNLWRVQVYLSVSLLYFCRVYTSSYSEIVNGKYVSRKATVIVGKKHNTEIAASMGEYLIKTTLRLAKAYSSYRKDILQFEKGCGLRLAQRVRELAEQQQKPTPTLPNSGLPALYRTELKLADDHLAGLSLRDGRGSSMKMGHGAVVGANAANGVSLGGQISGGSSRGNLLK